MLVKTVDRRSIKFDDPRPLGFELPVTVEVDSEAFRQLRSAYVAITVLRVHDPEPGYQGTYMVVGMELRDRLNMVPTATFTLREVFVP